MCKIYILILIQEIICIFLCCISIRKNFISLENFFRINQKFSGYSEKFSDFWKIFPKKQVFLYFWQIFWVFGRIFDF